MDGRTARRCVTARARAILTGAHVWQGMASEQHPAQAHHLASDTANTAATTAGDTNSAMVLGREAQLAQAAVHERLGACPRFLAWPVRLLPRFTLFPDDRAS